MHYHCTWMDPDYRTEDFCLIRHRTRQGNLCRASADRFTCEGETLQECLGGGGE